MSESFDPYYKWLGIPPKDQPPHHYRLLGIELFEEDRDVIDAAANRVMSYLKDISTGDDAAHSQTLLNEISRARICLLNKEKKAEYDNQLRQKLNAAGLLEGTPQERAARKPPPKPPKPIAPPPAKPPASVPPLPAVTPPPPASIDPIPIFEPEPAKAVGGEALKIVVSAEDRAKRAAARRKEKRRGADQERRPRKRSYRLAGVLAALFFIAVVCFIVSLFLFGGGARSEPGHAGLHHAAGKSGQLPLLVVMLSPQERKELIAFLLDGAPQSLPPTQQYQLAAGEHELVLRRDGYEEIRETMDLIEGVRREYRPGWEVSGGYGRMVGHWKLDGDTRDSSGGDHHATSSGSAAFVHGKIQRALHLSEVQRVEVREPLLAESSEFSLTLWIRLASVPDANRPILDGGSLDIHLQGGHPRLRVRRREPAAGASTDGETEAFAGMDLARHLNQWVHLGLVYSAPAHRVYYYLNGEHQGSQRYPQSAPAEMNRLEIGNLAGEIDDLRIFDYRLSSVAVRAIFDGTFQPPLAAPNAPNGEVACETWRAVPGRLTRSQIDRITLDPADVTSVLRKGLWDLLPPGGGNCLNRIRGFLYPPADGEYVFLLRSSGLATFYLQRFGTDEDSLAQIVVNDAASAQSEPVLLDGGKAYYFEVFHQYDGSQRGLRHFSLGCKPAGARKRRPFAPRNPINRQPAIPAEYLASYGDVE